MAHRRYKKCLWLLLAPLFFANGAWAQNTCTPSSEEPTTIHSAQPTEHTHHIAGVVKTDEPQRYLANVTINLLGTPYCTVSNNKGEFSLDIDQAMYPQIPTLLLTRNHYETKAFPIDHLANETTSLVLQLTRLQQYSNEEILHFYYTGRIKPTPIQTMPTTQERI